MGTTRLVIKANSANPEQENEKTLHIKSSNNKAVVHLYQE